MIKVHIAGGPATDTLERLEELTGGVFALTAGEITPSTSCDILVAGVVSGEQLDMCRGLKAVVVPYAGVPESTAALLEGRPGIMLRSIHHNAVAAAEMAVTLMMAAAKLIIPAHMALRNGDWSPRYTPSGLIIEDSRVTVLGRGSIGGRVERICSSMGASVRTVGRTPGNGTFTAGDLPGILPETDILVVCVPLTDETRGMIGEKELALMPRGSVLVNVARGPVVDEEALFHSLRSGHLGAAGIDVWYSYPGTEGSRKATPPSRFPFGELPNVVMSPHRGGAFGLPGIEERRLRHLGDILLELADGMVQHSSYISAAIPRTGIGGDMSSFDGVTVVREANFYFEGKVSSRTVIFPDGSRKTLGVMLPGEYTFGTSTHEIMEILSGELDVTLPGAKEPVTVTGGDTFQVPADSKFTVNVRKATDYCCSYGSE